ncbi:sulfurtransferase [Actinacidiphila cocklensis]|uniref:3-mercaptopyruvate sulfurtransferase n=1 Tax=Actinacidiphila cocklensis TaxID=887465 RepID=A0A9W4DQX8_9ACTN|nr:sulfurtransferase [Actinacidiphila cocklensis]CAG6394394.1 putative 3-mercaptopyruvate sulfurtransferase [Actinacidiphila cocklensis]
MSELVDVSPFAQVEELKDLPGHVVLADVRWYLDGRSGRAAYEGGHLPGAVFVDLDRWLSGRATPEGGRNPFPSPEVFTEGMRALGINDTDIVVAYDDQGGVIAARLVWMLRSTGRRAAILDGGLAAYVEAHPGSLTVVEPAPADADFSVRPWPAEALAAADEAAGPDDLAVDARNRDRFAGAQDPVDPRPGHVPGAVNVPCRENLDDRGRLLPVQQIRDNFAAAGVDQDSSPKVVSYCGSGVTACHNLLALEYAGLRSGRLFVGGWSAYSRDGSRPVETGPAR